MMPGAIFCDYELCVCVSEGTFVGWREDSEPSSAAVAALIRTGQRLSVTKANTVNVYECVSWHTLTFVLIIAKKAKIVRWIKVVVIALKEKLVTICFILIFLFIFDLYIHT